MYVMAMFHLHRMDVRGRSNSTLGTIQGRGTSTREVNCRGPAPVRHRPLLALIPGAVFILLSGAALGDHYFRDEFYYLACSRRMAWGYVDQPPFSIAALWLVRHVAGDALVVLRAVAALAAAAAVGLTGAIARRLGGSPFAQALAMLAAAISPALLALSSFYSMNAFDLLVWTAAAYLVIDVLDRPT